MCFILLEKALPQVCQSFCQRVLTNLYLTVISPRDGFILRGAAQEILSIFGQFCPDNLGASGIPLRSMPVGCSAARYPRRPHSLRSLRSLAIATAPYPCVFLKNIWRFPISLQIQFHINAFPVSIKDFFAAALPANFRRKNYKPKRTVVLTFTSGIKTNR